MWMRIARTWIFGIRPEFNVRAIRCLHPHLYPQTYFFASYFLTFTQAPLFSSHIINDGPVLVMSF